jgi:Protein of unknown function (DUF2924)
VDRSVWMELEKLRRANVARFREKYWEVFGEETRSRHREHLFRRIAWRLQARAERDLSVRARQRAQEIGDDADLRKIAPADFFTVGGQAIETIPGERSERKQDRRLPIEVACSRASGKDEPFWSKSSRRASGMRIGSFPPGARLRQRPQARAGTGWPSSA